MRSWLACFSWASKRYREPISLAKASRPLLEKERINLDIPHWMILKIDRVARRKGMPRQAQIKEWLSQKLKEEEPSAI